MIAAEVGGLVRLVVSDDGEVTGETVAALDKIITDVDVRDNVAYATFAQSGYDGTFYGGLITYDLSDSTTMTLMDGMSSIGPTLNMIRKYQNFRRHKALWTYLFSIPLTFEIHGNYAFVMDRDQTRVFPAQGGPAPVKPGGWIGVIDIRDPSNLQRGGVLSTNSTIRYADVNGNRLYVATDDGLSVFSIAKATKPRRLGTYDSEAPAMGITVINETAVLTTMAGYEFLDVSNPKKIQLVSSFDVLAEQWFDSLQERHLAVGGTDLFCPLAGSGVLSVNAEDLQREDLTGDNAVTGRARFTLGDTPVTVKITGGGSIDIDFDGFNPWIDSFTVTGATPQTVVTVTTPRRKRVTICDISIDGPIKKFLAKSTTLTGDFAAAGSVGALALADVGGVTGRDEQTISIGPAGDSGPATTAVTLASVFDARLISQTPMRSLTVTRWVDNETEWLNEDGAAVDEVDRIEAPYVGKFTVKGAKGVSGDFQADLLLNEAGSADVLNVLGATVIKGSASESDWSIGGNVAKIAVRGDAADSVWRIEGKSGPIKIGGTLDESRLLLAGDSGAVTVGGMVRSDFYAGYVADDADAVTGLPTVDELVGGSFDSLSTIKSFAIKGLKISRRVFADSFIDSNIAAPAIGFATLRYGVLNNNSSPFGVTARALTKLTYKDADISRSWAGTFPDGTPGSDDLDDLIVRIV